MSQHKSSTTKHNQSMLDYAGWQELPRLAGQLMAESTIAGQRDLIITAAAHLTGGQAELWLAEPFHHIMGAEGVSTTSPDPPSDLMRQAFGSEKVEISPTPAIALPLPAHGSIIGVLQTVRPTGPPFDDAEIELLQSLVTQSAIAIEQSRRYQESQAQAWTSTVLLQVAEAIQSQTTAEDVLETVIRLMPMLAGVDRCAVLLWDAAAGAFVPGAAYGLDSSRRAAFKQLLIAPGDAPAFDHLRLLKRDIAIQDTATDARLPARFGLALGFESLLLLALVSRGEVVGAMLVDDKSERSGFSEAWRAMIHGIAHQTAVAVESIRLLEAQQEEAYVLAALLQVAQAVAGFQDLDDTLNAIVRTIPILVGVDRCIIFLWDHERAVFQPVQMYGVPRRSEATLLGRHYTPADFPLLSAIRDQDNLMLLETPEQWRELVPSDFQTDFQVDSLLAVPLSLQGDVLGAMLIEEASAARRFREKRLEIITGIAQQAALAVQNHRFQQEMARQEGLDRELQLAREIQQTLMPDELPDLPNWELAAACRPALQVSGDFYDFFKLPGDQLGLVIADVADKGVPAALFMALTRALIRAAALQETSPAAALARVNDLLVPDTHQGMFVTAAYAVLSLETGRMAYANAGHNLPLLWRADSQAVERLEKCGMALGVLEELRLEERIIYLGQGDQLVFYTDGVTEAFSSDNEAYGESRLQATIPAAGNLPARAMLNVITDSVSTFVGDRPPSDDLTLLVLRRLDI